MAPLPSIRFVITEKFTNPDGNEGVLLTTKGERLKLLDKSDTWWWMAKANGAEGWALATILVPEAEYDPRADTRNGNGNGAKAAANPFGDSRVSTDSPNPFDMSGGGPGEKPGKQHSRQASNPFDLKSQTDGAPQKTIGTYNPNPFEEAVAEEQGDETAPAPSDHNPFLYDHSAEDPGAEDPAHDDESYLSQDPTEAAEKEAANPFVQAAKEKEAANPFAAEPKVSNPFLAPGNSYLEDDAGNRVSHYSDVDIDAEMEIDRAANPFASPAAAEAAVTEEEQSPHHKLPPGMDDSMDDMMASMMGGISDLDARIASMKAAEAVKTPEPEPEPDSDSDPEPEPQDAAEPEPEQSTPVPMDDMMASMLGGISDLDARIANMKAAEPGTEPEPTAEVEEEEEEEEAPLPGIASSDPEDAYYSDLQPFTYITADGTLSTLFGADVAAYAPPEWLVGAKRVRAPEHIIGPAIVTHDNTWRVTGDASLFAPAHAAFVLDVSDTEC